MLETDYIECVIEFCFPLEAGMSALHHWEENSDTPVLWAKITPCNESEGIKISIFVVTYFCSCVWEACVVYVVMPMCPSSEVELDVFFYHSSFYF